MIYDYAEAYEYGKDKVLAPMDPDNYRPIKKLREFNPNPLVSADHTRQHIPYWADGKNNPECIGTSDYWDFWNEQVERCIEGYETGGIWIPGRYYYYLNFTKISGVLGVQFPWYIDLDLEYFRTVEYIKDAHKLGMVSIKARRKGLSEKAQAILNHGLRFIERYAAGVAAGDDKYVLGIKKKFKNANISVVDEMKMHVLKDNPDQYLIGYQSMNSFGEFEDDGYGGQIRFATMYDKDTKLEGEYFNDVVLEEAGQFAKLGGAIESIKPALMMGGYVGGTFYIFGTGGNVLSSSRDFMEIFYEADKLGYVKFWVSAKRMLFPFLGNPFSLYAKVDPEDDEAEEVYGMGSYEGWEEYEFVGCEDVWGAEKWVLERRESYVKLKRKKKLIKHNQSFPLTVEEAFTSGGTNNFDSGVLFQQLHTIHEEDVEILDYVLSYKKEIKDGVPTLKFPLEVESRLAKASDPEWERVRILEHPRKGYVNLDVGGVDSYNQDMSETSDSLGGMVVLRRYNESPNGKDNGIKPICTYYDRPPRKEQFFDICLKIAVYYNLIGNTMLSAESELIIDYFAVNGGLKYMSLRPRSFDAPGSKPSYKFGVKMTEHTKPMMLGILQSYYMDYSGSIWFEEIIRDALAYDESNIGTDWDLTDALGYAMMRIVDMKRSPQEEKNDVDARYDNALPTGDDINDFIRYSDENDMTDSGRNEKIFTEERGNWI